MKGRDRDRDRNNKEEEIEEEKLEKERVISSGALHVQTCMLLFV